MEQANPALEFEAVIVPHRSLSRRGLRNLALGLAGLSGLVSTGLWLAGAWPVIGFTGLEAALAILLLLRHALGARASEVLLLSSGELRVIRLDRRGRRSELALPAAWLRSDLVERPGRTPALLVRQRGRELEIGAALGEDEKRALAEALSDALWRQRNPTAGGVRPRSDPST